ncbi:family 20 glycosylhydrolase [Actinoplanes sp. NPDC049548]|uniref:family 20 glycosylhydrolase n=1 Tax=Actinoplanes sp. NPDC049548 TaxID=3155152 RepID=UPI003446D7D6
MRTTKTRVAIGAAVLMAAAAGIVGAGFADAATSEVATIAQRAAEQAPAWQPNTAYAVGAKVSYDGVEYTCRQAHTSLVTWEPPATPALWLAVPATVPSTVPSSVPSSGAPSSEPPAVQQVAGVIPAPVEYRQDQAASFTITDKTVVRTADDEGAKKVGEQLAAALRPATGFPLDVTTGTGTGAIALLLDGADQRVGAEGYQLDVAADGVTIRATAAAGLHAGVQTLLQLLPPEIEAGSKKDGKWVVPGGRIVDFPRFAYRGAMLDLARHFHPANDVKSYIDQIAKYKINYLHLHLTDDQGWRIEIKKWPDLTVKGGGEGTGVNGKGPGFLTQQEYADLVAYAADRFITVVPEIDMPGHSNAAQAAYPELNCDGKAVPPRTDIEVGYSSFCVAGDKTYAFLDDVLGELAELTPGPYLHIGGDEAKATTDADYRTFMSKVLPLVAKHGKKVLGWNEITAADLPEGAVAQWWNTTNSDPNLATAAGKGTKVLMSPANKAYLDQKYDASTPIGLSWAGPTSVKTAYDWDPGALVQGVGEENVLGVEAPLWSETLLSSDDIEFMAFPRLPALAEVAWSAKASHDWEGFRARLASQAPRWAACNVNFFKSPEIDWKE